ncbi:MAG: response regulator [Sedimentisphaerales bacterium]|jgi:CheY-like chemotaxis protein
MHKILVVEDNEKNMYLMVFLLSKAGYQVIQAKTGEEGVRLAQKEKPDIIIMDVMLPDIDGLEVTRKIRESKENDKVPIVAVTSFAMAGDKEKVLAAGCTGYIEKPINVETLLGEIEKYLKAK